MALVRIASFEDRQEAHIAAGALRAAGIGAIVYDVGYAVVDNTMIRAVGGYPLSVLSDDAEQAAALLQSFQVFNPEVLDWMRQPQVVSALPLSLFASLMGEFGWLIAGAVRKDATLRRRVITVLVFAAFLPLLILPFVGIGR